VSCCLTAIFLLGLISVTALVAVLLSSAIFFLRSNEVVGQNREVVKQDIFKVIVTVNGLDHESGDVITLVTVNGFTKSKLFDDTKTYLSSSNTGKPTIIEYTSTFPNMTVKIDSQFKACALLVRNSELICHTGKNSPAFRPEIVDLYIEQDKSTKKFAHIVPLEQEK
jgi:hypothetical protein